MAPTEEAGGAVSPLRGKHRVLLRTTLGDITLELDADAAPRTVTNFVELVRRGYYDMMIFHRVINDFMIQGGDPTSTGAGGMSIYGGEFEDEHNSITLERGVVAMANRGPNTNRSQFFIIQRRGGTPHLQGKHTAFGRVISGLDVLDAIAAVQTGAGGRPVTDVEFTPTLL